MRQSIAAACSRRPFETVPLLDAARERELLTLALGGSPSATRELVQSHMRLVVKIASRYQRPGLALEDLISEGVLGLMESLRRFDLERGVRFSVYASWWIRARVSQYALANRRAVGMPSTRNARAVLRELRRAERKLSQRLARAPSHDELAHELGVSAQDVAQVRAALGMPDLSVDATTEGSLQLADEADSPESLIAEREACSVQRAQVHEALGALSARERTLVHAQYLDESARSLAELGRDYGVSRQRLGQVLSNAREKLKLELVRGAARLGAPQLSA